MSTTRTAQVASGIAVAALLMSGCGGASSAAPAVDEAAAPAADDATATADATAVDPTDDPVEAPAFTPEDAIDVVEAIGQAYNNYDTRLFFAVTAEDFQFVDERGTADRSTQASYFPALREGSHQGQRTGEVVVISEDPFVVAEDVVVTADFYPPEGRVGTSTYTLVVEDGELKVLEHRWTGDLL